MRGILLWLVMLWLLEPLHAQTPCRDKYFGGCDDEGCIAQLQAMNNARGERYQQLAEKYRQECGAEEPCDDYQVAYDVLAAGLASWADWTPCQDARPEGVERVADLGLQAPAPPPEHCGAELLELYQTVTRHFLQLEQGLGEVCLEPVLPCALPFAAQRFLTERRRRLCPNWQDNSYIIYVCTPRPGKPDQGALCLSEPAAAPDVCWPLVQWSPEQQAELDISRGQEGLLGAMPTWPRSRTGGDHPLEAFGRPLIDGRVIVPNLTYWEALAEDSPELASTRFHFLFASADDDGVRIVDAAGASREITVDPRILEGLPCHCRPVAEEHMVKNRRAALRLELLVRHPDLRWAAATADTECVILPGTAATADLMCYHVSWLREEADGHPNTLHAWRPMASSWFDPEIETALRHQLLTEPREAWLDDLFSELASSVGSRIVAIHPPPSPTEPTMSTAARPRILLATAEGLSVLARGRRIALPPPTETLLRQMLEVATEAESPQRTLQQRLTKLVLGQPEIMLLTTEIDHGVCYAVPGETEPAELWCLGLGSSRQPWRPLALETLARDGELPLGAPLPADRRSLLAGRWVDHLASGQPLDAWVEGLLTHLLGVADRQEEELYLLDLLRDNTRRGALLIDVTAAESWSEDGSFQATWIDATGRRRSKVPFRSLAASAQGRRQSLMRSYGAYRQGLARHFATTGDGDVVRAVASAREPPQGRLALILKRGIEERLALAAEGEVLETRRADCFQNAVSDLVDRAPTLDQALHGLLDHYEWNSFEPWPFNPLPLFRDPKCR